MLFTKTEKTFRDMIDSTCSPVAIIPASQPHIPDSLNVQRANDMALLAQANGMGVFVLEGYARQPQPENLCCL
jgi:hypothetical protein